MNNIIKNKIRKLIKIDGIICKWNIKWFIRVLDTTILYI